MKKEDSINFSKKIYPKKAIQSGIEAFKHLAEFKLTNKRNYFNIRIVRLGNEENTTLKDEFSNFILAMIKEI